MKDRGELVQYKYKDIQTGIEEIGTTPEVEIDIEEEALKEKEMKDPTINQKATGAVNNQKGREVSGKDLRNTRGEY
jgi:hypothetical protein